MNFEELLDAMRDLYLESFQAAIAEQRRLHPEAELAIEPILRGETGEPLLEGALKLPMRGDLVVAAEQVLGLSVDAPELLAFDPFEFVIEEAQGPTFAVFPFSWDDVEVTLAGLDAERTDWSPLIAWFLAWFDEESEPQDDRGLSGVVHALSDPVIDDDFASFIVDLGSAPVAAFEDLVAALQMLGPTACRFGTPDDDDEPDHQPEEVD
jgi:hypothetical protein